MKTDFQTEKYAYAIYPWQQDEKGYYFPDFIVDAVLRAAKDVTESSFATYVALDRQGGILSPLNKHRLLLPKPELLWEQSCDLVVEAFAAFDPRLGNRAREVMMDSARWETEKVIPGEAGGCCKLVNQEGDEPPLAVIEYQYDGTICDPVYIAHELGHLFAADFSQVSGAPPRQHMAEVQAFFMQHVLYDYLMKHANEDIRAAATRHYIGEITRGLYKMPLALGALEVEHAADKGAEAVPYGHIMTSWLGENWGYFESADKLGKNIDQAGERDQRGLRHLHGHSMASILARGLFAAAAQSAGADRQHIADIVLGRNGPKNIVDALSSAGGVSEDRLEKFCREAVGQAIAPLTALKNSMRPCPTASLHRGGRRSAHPAPGS